MKECAILYSLLILVSCKMSTGSTEADMSEQVYTTYDWYFDEFLPQLNEPYFDNLDLKTNAIRVTLLSPMGFPSFVYTYKELNKNEVLISYKRECYGKFSIEGKSWIIESDSILFTKLEFSKTFLEMPNNKESGDGLMWVVEQKVQEDKDFRFLLGTNIEDVPEEIKNFFQHFPSFVPSIDSLIGERCHIPYK